MSALAATSVKPVGGSGDGVQFPVCVPAPKVLPSDTKSASLMYWNVQVVCTSNGLTSAFSVAVVLPMLEADSLSTAGAPGCGGPKTATSSAPSATYSVFSEESYARPVPAVRWLKPNVSVGPHAPLGMTWHGPPAWTTPPAG